MKGLFAVLLFLSINIVLSAPVFFETAFLKDSDPRFSVHHYTEFHDRHHPRQGNLRFWLLVPKLGADFKDGFKCRKDGLVQVSLDFFKLDEDESLYEFTNFTDALSWNAVYMGVWGPAGLYYKSFVVTNDGLTSMKLSYFNNVDELVDYVYTKTTADHLRTLLTKGLAAHVYTYKVLKKFGLL